MPAANAAGISAATRIDLVLLWHMHQPDYRDHATGEFHLPWVYLHALKDYSDMAWHLEQHPGMRAVVNFAPILLQQIDDYADQFATGRVRDRLLRLLRHPGAEPLTPGERAHILARCFRTNHERVIAPFPRYLALLEIFREIEQHGDDAQSYLSDQYFYDLLTWYHLGWTGESLRRESDFVAHLTAKAAHFSENDRSGLFELIGETIGGIIPRWRRLAERGQVELSTTPECHPLAPLLLDFASAREALPNCALPALPYPGGRERVDAQIDAALSAHAQWFGMPAAGSWPAEGALSTEVLELLAARGLRWTASGGEVLRNSLAAGPVEAPPGWLYRPYRVDVPGSKLACFFRDDFLSDRIGFEYAKWNGDDAALDMITAIERTRAAVHDGETPVVSIILDGENCWEYYPYNGHYFLDALYRSLETHATIRPTTYSDWLGGRTEPYPPAAGPVATATLSRLVAGSWVGGNFATWIGSPDRNHAWDLLCAAKRCYDHATVTGKIDPERAREATRQLAVCEASDWFWWLSDVNPAFAVAELESLFRSHLAHLYRLLDEPPPAALAQSISHGAGTPEAGGTMRRAA